MRIRVDGRLSDNPPFSNICLLTDIGREHLFGTVAALRSLQGNPFSSGCLEGISPTITLATSCRSALRPHRRLQTDFGHSRVRISGRASINLWFAGKDTKSGGVGGR